MTARTHEAIRVGLRKLIRDPNASAKERLEAIKLLMSVEGLMDAEMPKNRPTMNRVSHTDDNRLRELLELAEEKKTG